MNLVTVALNLMIDVSNSSYSIKFILMFVDNLNILIFISTFQIQGMFEHDQRCQFNYLDSPLFINRISPGPHSFCSLMQFTLLGQQTQRYTMKMATKMYLGMMFMMACIMVYQYQQLRTTFPPMQWMGAKNLTSNNIESNEVREIHYLFITTREQIPGCVLINVLSSKYFAV